MADDAGTNKQMNIKTQINNLPRIKTIVSEYLHLNHFGNVC